MKAALRDPLEQRGWGGGGRLQAERRRLVSQGGKATRARQVLRKVVNEYEFLGEAIDEMRCIGEG